jgi:hypothetical protein
LPDNNFGNFAADRFDAACEVFECFDVAHGWVVGCEKLKIVFC